MSGNEDFLGSIFNCCTPLPTGGVGGEFGKDGMSRAKPGAYSTQTRAWVNPAANIKSANSKVGFQVDGPDGRHPVGVNTQAESAIDQYLGSRVPNPNKPLPQHPTMHQSPGDAAGYGGYGGAMLDAYGNQSQFGAPETSHAAGYMEHPGRHGAPQDMYGQQQYADPYQNNPQLSGLMNQLSPRDSALIQAETPFPKADMTFYGEDPARKHPSERWMPPAKPAIGNHHGDLNDLKPLFGSFNNRRTEAGEIHLDAASIDRERNTVPQNVIGNSGQTTPRVLEKKPGNMQQLAPTGPSLQSANNPPNAETYSVIFYLVKDPMTPVGLQSPGAKNLRFVPYQVKPVVQSADMAVPHDVVEHDLPSGLMSGRSREMIRGPDGLEREAWVQVLADGTTLEMPDEYTYAFGTRNMHRILHTRLAWPVDINATEEEVLKQGMQAYVAHHQTLPATISELLAYCD